MNQLLIIISSYENPKYSLCYVWRMSLVRGEVAEECGQCQGEGGKW